MQNNPTTNPKKRGRPLLSPNGVREELKPKKKPGKKAKRIIQSRTKTERRKRDNDRLRRERAKRLKRQGWAEEPGRIVRRRMRTVRYYWHWHERFSEADAAQRAAQKFEVSVSTVRNWERAYRKGGLAALVPKKSGPQHAEQVISWETQCLVVVLRRLWGWNEKRIAAELKQRGLAELSHTSVGRIFKRYALPTRTYHSKGRCDGIPKGRYEKRKANQQWHVDFAEIKLQDGTPVRILVLIDDYSRYALRCQIVPDLTAETTIQCVQSAILECGAPDELVSDNGSSFTSTFPGTPNRFGLFLKQKGIRHSLISPYWPEGNGKAEAFVKIVKHECLKRPFSSLEAVKAALAEFLVFYNHFRLHGALGFQTPVSRFLVVPSPKNHGLAGIPNMPSDLLAKYPPRQPVTIHIVNRDAVARPFALALVNF